MLPLGIRLSRQTKKPPPRDKQGLPQAHEWDELRHGRWHPDAHDIHRRGAIPIRAREHLATPPSEGDTIERVLASFLRHAQRSLAIGELPRCSCCSCTPLLCTVAWLPSALTPDNSTPVLPMGQTRPNTA